VAFISASTGFTYLLPYFNRFEDAVKNATTASQIDPGNREIANLAKRTKAVASARSRGNNHFKASRFLEACISYGEGLGHEPHNAVLLCNRAACQSKLGNYQKAVEDCNVALSIRTAYSKARLRRADCNAKVLTGFGVLRVAASSDNLHFSIIKKHFLSLIA
jgi:tetratricopeptide (TPR) repeat protein